MFSQQSTAYNSNSTLADPGLLPLDKTFKEGELRAAYLSGADLTDFYVTEGGREVLLEELLLSGDRARVMGVLRGAVFNAETRFSWDEDDNQTIHEFLASMARVNTEHPAGIDLRGASLPSVPLPPPPAAPAVAPEPIAEEEPTLGAVRTPYSEDGTVVDVVERPGEEPVFIVMKGRLEEAHEEARQTFPIFSHLFHRERDDFNGFCVKFPMEDEEGFVEHVWMVVHRMSNGTIDGLLLSTPLDEDGKPQGSLISIRESQVSDWMVIKDGVRYGEFTTRAIIASLDEEARREYVGPDLFPLSSSPLPPGWPERELERIPKTMRLDRDHQMERWRGRSR